MQDQVSNRFFHTGTMSITFIRARADIVVTSEDGDVQLVTEIKEDIAVDESLTRKAYERYKQLNQHCYFLLITPRRFWLWSPSGEVITFKGETPILLERYIHLDKISLSTLDWHVFASVVYSWLGSVIFKSANALLEMPAQRWLVETGLHPLIYRGYVRWEKWEEFD